MSVGVVRFPRAVPGDDPIAWGKVFRDLNRVITVDSDEFVLLAATALSDRTGVPVTDILSLLGDTGKATSQRLMPTLNFANVGSIQSAIPLTATADAVTSVVSIAAHSVYIGGETVSYNSGSVVGVPVSTDVYIYADDANLAGGAVTYAYTTAFTDLAASAGRYRVGAIRTPVSSISASVTAATNANPGAVTTGAAHGFTTGDQVQFSGVGGMTNINTGTYTITVTGGTTFTIGVDSTAYGIYTTGGTVTRVTTPAAGIGGAGADGGTYDIGIYY